VNAAISVWGGRGIVSCSGDGCLKLWTSTKEFNLEEEDPIKQKKKVVFPAVCRGEMWGHTDEVKILLKLTETSFASGGNDNLIIHWKDGDLESLGRNSEAFLSLLQGNSHRLLYKSDIFLEGQVNLVSANHAGSSGAGFQLSPFEDVDDQDDSSSGLVTANEGPYFDDEDGVDRNDDDDDNGIKHRYFNESDGSGELTALRPIKDVPNDNHDEADNGPALFSGKSPLKNIRPPTYILDHAENLLFEQQKSLSEIQDYLQSQGHSDAIVDAVMVRLRQIHNMYNKPM